MARKQVDERILATKRRVTAGGFQILFLGLLIILLYRQFYLGQEFKDYGDIFVLWLLGSFYVTIRGSLSGLNLFTARKYNFIITPLVIAGSVLGVNIYRGSVNSLWEGVLAFTTAFAGAGIAFYFLATLYRNWERKNLDQ